MKANSIHFNYLWCLLFAVTTACPAATGRIVTVINNAVILSNGVFWSDANSSEEPVYFADANLKAAVEDALGVTDPTPTDMLELATLHGDTARINDLTGLEHATNLEELYIPGNQIDDILPLSELYSLKILDLWGNNISDVSALAGLRNIEKLYLLKNQISDISPLSGLTNLEVLNLAENRTSDISPLSNLTGLWTLYLYQNQISDISPLSGLTRLQTLDLYQNQIGDIAPLSNLRSLCGLSLNNNQITDISPLSNLSNLCRLSLGYNQISNISPLSDFRNLGYLYLDNNQINDISPLSGCVNLQRLSLGRNHISNISPLAGLTRLEFLYLYYNQISDISSLSDLTNLEELDLIDNQISDISPLSGLTSLKFLELNRNQIIDISPLLYLTGMELLFLRSNPLGVDAYTIYIPQIESYGTEVYCDPLIWRTLTVSSTDNGSVTEPGEGEFDYTNNTVVDIEAIADPGCYFVAWTGTAVDAGKVANPYSPVITVTMDEDYTLRANFEKVHIIYVDDDTLKGNNGSNWENAYLCLQDALTEAEEIGKPVEIHVAQGIYRPDQRAMMRQGLLRTVSSGDWTATFQLINGVTIEGGYAGLGEPDPDARDIEQYESILSGDLNADYDPDLTNIWDNCYHVVTADGTNTTAILDGFTITGGNADGAEPYDNGGGIYNNSGDPRLSDCKFVGNYAQENGGGMYNNNSSKPILTNCTFIGNSAKFGGGMSNDNSNPTLLNCILTWNSADMSGGGMHNSQSYPTLNNCTFFENSGWGAGGGMFNDECELLMLSDCAFYRNSSSAGSGGGMFNYNSNPELLRCIFSGNWVLWGGGGMANEQNCDSILTKCIFSGNRAELGGGMYNNNSDPTLMNCTFSFSGNLSCSGIALATDYSLNPSHITLKNCIIWGEGKQIFNNDCSTINISYSNVSRSRTVIYDPCEIIIWGEGNIDEDPLFAARGYWVSADDPNIIAEPYQLSAVWNDGDYHLRSQAGRWDPVNEDWVIDDVTSPCIDTGDPNTPIGYEPFPNGHRINMGAYGGTVQASMSLYDPVDYLKQASNPNPADGDYDVILDIMPSWISDPNADAYEIYFGASEFPPFLRKQDETEFDPGALEQNTQYYWRIDNIDILSNRTIGNIWTFLTGPKPACAYNPSPVNGFEDIVAYKAVLTWNPGLNAVEHNVYLGTCFHDAFIATEENSLGILVSAGHDSNSYEPGHLEFDQTYYWRIDEIDDHDIITPGNVWTFTTGSHPVQAYNPNPPDGTMNASPEVIISWSPGKDAVSHDVYFGFTNPPEFVRNQIETEYDPPGLLPSLAQCYWRIDEIDSQGNIIPGEIWRFKVHEYKGRFCLISEICVWINGAAVPISKVAVGQSIGSLDVCGKVEKVQEHEGTFTLYDILLESGNFITVAENHFFMTESGKWLSLHDLKAGSRLKTAKGIVGITGIKKRPEAYIGKVYNLKVAGSDQYMVGEDAVIVRDY
jgi:parallel beta-helix repeat protein